MPALRNHLLLLAIAVCADVSAANAAATATGYDVALRACASIAARVDATTGTSPLFLRSYDNERGNGEPDEPALRTAAFTYDNALAVIALIACDKPAQALRIGEALRAAGNDARLRNVYRAGAVAARPLPNGWWDAKQNRWVEDAYQQGSASGNLAWAALAFLNLLQATADKRWLDAAAHQARWITNETRDAHGADGFSGGVFGFDQDPQTLTWKSTEHNIDLVAVFDWLASTQPNEKWLAPAASARRFLASQWDEKAGRFFIGTLPDGITPNRTSLGLDTELWPSLLRDAPKPWTRALDYAEHEFIVDGGFDFNTDRDGLWLEGTAQAALADRVAGRDDKARTLLSTIDKQFSDGGLVYATREPRITTGLSNSPDSASADFYYYRRPHLGATAWAALAALKYNPFVGRAASAHPDNTAAAK